MAYEYLLAGTQRFVQHGYIGSTSPNYSTRILSMHVLGASTSGTAYIVLASGTGAQLTTVSAMGTVYLAVSPVNSSNGYCWGEWDNGSGYLLEGPVLLMTKTGLTCAVVNYVQILK